MKTTHAIVMAALLVGTMFVALAPTAGARETTCVGPACVNHGYWHIRRCDEWGNCVTIVAIPFIADCYGIPPKCYDY